MGGGTSEGTNLIASRTCAPLPRIYLTYFFGGVTRVIIPVVRPVGAHQQQSQSQVTLQPGHTYRAVVVGQEASTVLLRIGGVLIRGESELSLPVGQVIHLEAQHSQEHTMVLRVVQNTASASQAPDLGQVLLQLGVSANPSTRMVATVLLNWLLPLNPEQVRKLVRELRNVPAEHQEAFVNVQGWARSTGLDEQGPVLRMVTRFLLGDAEAEEVPPAMRQINHSGQSPAYPEVQVLWWEQAPHHGEIYVLKEKRGATSHDNIHLAVRISTVHYGEAWAGFSYGGRILSLSFHGEDEQLLTLIEEQKPLLVSAVENSGLTLAGITCYRRRALSFLDVFPLAQTSAYQGINFLV